jgi:hypothetical protein
MQCSLKTEQVYLQWVRFFVRWHGRDGTIQHPRHPRVGCAACPKSQSILCVSSYQTCSKTQKQRRAGLREPPWGADGQTARAMLAKQASKPQGWAGANTKCAAKPLIKTMREAPDISHNLSTPPGQQTAARRARSDREAQAAGDRSSVDNFA